jgi:hypothetical protein
VDHLLARNAIVWVRTSLTQTLNVSELYLAMPLETTDENESFILKCVKLKIGNFRKTIGSIGGGEDFGQWLGYK